MVVKINPCFGIKKTSKAEVLRGKDPGSWHLKIPAGPQGVYRLAQLDDGFVQSRDQLPWKSPITLNLRARVSASNIQGTWGFGFWNDPFSLSLGLGGGTQRFPALPNAAWFFFSSPQNYLSFRNDLPANGLIAQTFHSRRLPSPILALGVFAFPTLFWPWLARKLRASLSRLAEEDSFPFKIDVTQWHNYTLEWRKDKVTFKINNQTLETRISPNAPMGFVLWIDNQYASFPPNGKLAFGTLANLEPACLEIEALQLESRVGGQ